MDFRSTNAEISATAIAVARHTLPRALAAVSRLEKLLQPHLGRQVIMLSRHIVNCSGFLAFLFISNDGFSGGLKPPTSGPFTSTPLIVGG